LIGKQPKGVKKKKNYNYLLARAYDCKRYDTATSRLLLRTGIPNKSIDFLLQLAILLAKRHVTLLLL
jgi:hypothetical protein